MIKKENNEYDYNDNNDHGDDDDDNNNFFNANYVPLQLPLWYLKKTCTKDPSLKKLFVVWHPTYYKFPKLYVSADKMNHVLYILFISKILAKRNIIWFKG